MNDVLGHDSALVRLHWAGDNLGYWDEFLWIMPQVQDRSFDLLTGSPAPWMPPSCAYNLCNASLTSYNPLFCSFSSCLYIIHWNIYFYCYSVQVCVLRFSFRDDKFPVLSLILYWSTSGDSSQELEELALFIAYSKQGCRGVQVLKQVKNKSRMTWIVF